MPLGLGIGRLVFRDAVLAGQPVEGQQRPSVGCGIKWRPGNEPDYSFG